MGSQVAMRPKQAAEALGIGVATLYRRMNAGDIQTIRFGGARLIPCAEIDRVVKGRSESARPAA